jgi:hypothetical protein
MKRVLWVFAASMSLIATSLVATTVQAATPRVPKTDWPLCSAQRVSYCIDSVTVELLGYAPVQLQWVPSGEAVPVPTSPETLPATPLDPNAAQGTTQTDPNATTAPDPNAGKPPAATSPTAPPEPYVTATLGKQTFAGRWTVPDWAFQGLGLYGYDGFYVRAKTANEFVNHVMIDVLPAKIDATNKAFLAAQADGIYATGLDPDLMISVKLKTGDIRAGVTLAVGLDVAVDYEVAADGQSNITISGSPVIVALAQRTQDCVGESGKAVANVRQFQAILFLQNDTSGFGVEGMSGKMYAGSNGVCGFSTPVWDAGASEMKWQVASPHFAADGTSVNKGFYKALVPYQDAKLLWGLDNPADAVTALSVSMTTDSGGTAAALFNISALNGYIIIDASGFEYSRPTLRVKMKSGYKATTAKLQTLTCSNGKKTEKLVGLGKALACPRGFKAVTTASSSTSTSTAKKVTITCVKGQTVKKITAVKPTCPAGFRKK